jgi:hypothetical protein
MHLPLTQRRFLPNRWPPKPFKKPCLSAQNLLSRIPRSALLASVAVSAWCALPAHAATTIYPGAMCTSDGPVARRINGELWNKNTDIETHTLFHCPVVLTESFANGGINGTPGCGWAGIMAYCISH